MQLQPAAIRRDELVPRGCERLDGGCDLRQKVETVETVE